MEADSPLIRQPVSSVNHRLASFILARNCWDSSPTSAWLLSDGYPAQLAQDRRHLAHRYPDTVVQGMGAREYAVSHTVRRRSVLARIDLRVLPA